MDVEFVRVVLLFDAVVSEVFQGALQRGDSDGDVFRMDAFD